MVAPHLAAASAALLAVLLVAAAPTSHAQAAAPSAFLGQLGAANTSSPVGTELQLCCPCKLLSSTPDALQWQLRVVAGIDKQLLQVVLRR